MANTRKDWQNRLLALIGEVYDAAQDQSLWWGLAPKIAATFDSTSTALHVRNLNRSQVELLGMTSNYDILALDTYEAYYAARDVWVQRAVARGTSGVVSSKDLIADAEFERTEIYNDWVRPVGIYYMVGAAFPIATGELGVLGVHRPRKGGNYDEDEKARVAQFLPHLTRALQIRRRFTDAIIERSAALDGLDRSGVATVVVLGDGRILYANQAAEAVLRQGEALRVINNRLASPDRRTAGRLAALIQAVVKTAAGQAADPGKPIAVPRLDRLPLTLLVAPFRPARDGVGTLEPAAVLFIRDPEGPTPAHAALQNLFGLTPAEAAVAARLGDGQAIDTIGTALGISLNTARSHLKSIYLKTGTSRQAQLVALLLRSIASLRV